MRYILLVSLFFSTYMLSAQYETAPIIRPDSKIELHFIPGDGYYYVHEIQKGHTIYSLARAFGLSVNEVKAINDLDDSGSVSLGQKILIPVPVTKIVQDYHPPRGVESIPVYYKVKAKENLFRISKMYFAQSVEMMKARNELHDNNLSIGQSLCIGWLIYGGEPQNTPVSTTVVDANRYEDQTIDSSDETLPKTDLVTIDNAVTDTVAMEDVVKIPSGFNRELLAGTPYNGSMKSRSETTVAHWDRTIPDNGTAYALHNSAMPGTYIKIHNPLVKRAVKAKVIGKIPFGTYTSDVKLVISPKAAKILGGLDQRFRVKIEYIK